MHNEKTEEFSFKKNWEVPRNGKYGLWSMLAEYSSNLFVGFIRFFSFAVLCSVMTLATLEMMKWGAEFIAKNSTNPISLKVREEREAAILDRMAFNHAYIEVLQERHPEIAKEISKVTVDKYPCLDRSTVKDGSCNLGEAILRSIGLAPESSQEPLEQVLNSPDKSSIEYALGIGKYSDSE